MTKDGSTFPAYSAVSAVLRAPVFEYNGLRKIVQSVGYSLAREIFPSVSLTDIGYTRAKEKAIFRMYYNEAEADRVRSLLVKRKGQGFSAISMSMRAGAKDSRSMGHCIDSIVLSMTNKRRVAEVLYRSTEVIKKFSADLWFIPQVLDRLGFEADEIKFYYTNAYLSGVFFPTLFTWWEPISFLRKLYRDEPKFFIFGTRFLVRSVVKRDQIFPYAPEEHQHRYLWKHHAPRVKEIRDYLKEKLA